jgi:hypothetical protein
MARRDNDRKVLAVKVQMQDLMTAFFELAFPSLILSLALIILEFAGFVIFEIQKRKAQMV